MKVNVLHKEQAIFELDNAEGVFAIVDGNEDYVRLYNLVENKIEGDFERKHLMTRNPVRQMENKTIYKNALNKEWEPVHKVGNTIYALDDNGRVCVANIDNGVITSKEIKDLSVYRNVPIISL